MGKTNLWEVESFENYFSVKFLCAHEGRIVTDHRKCGSTEG